MIRCFIDSNIVVYANDTRAGLKQDKAIETISVCMTVGNGVVIRRAETIKSLQDLGWKLVLALLV